MQVQQQQQQPSSTQHALPSLQSITLPTSSSKSPFFAVPAVPHLQQPTTSRPQAKPSFTIPHPNPVKPEQTPPSPNIFTYKAPAHKHAHHLHSIPPKEKTVQTLILDHMLWLHSRTRFNQVR
ncbi:uncharacterized protein EI90DRAFT_3084529 [Cantharellus anzutake]|uniref:uncharacterized protein n=1 Tax=Cantharellus anzutake TaxID=1750568 RepID=UPI00190508C1|nr:uncharacterized protein EI90DRAFT_3084529 [Cantharellus anzutake]KAF8318050.1 hypothetical protein EI90DRAFT_3084529 [Cantharellus anzutake]